ncbi:MAG TPA: deoxyribodipyrimidine photo-lyase [Atribacter sp.]|jgi:deoxyribodipyrimidine photo-lyase|uniref:deoxyribodipyrimidine photo-lyase n=1 Tax=Atribacter sp. TaxID=2847780 RepID=UPI0017666854|nr:deoxyribodipyrimidine photo-lyase [Atribacter sp.]MDD3714098.1 deoxyribodipyrimidine photo-lyase [Atribacterota bacterium]MDI9595315.1 deoxyribodipyrimidine photo-lyase [Atribacterota bacterium]HHT11104.1 deoxyribodipyrimidine photo-lyase [Candidatus Atribacteria bacterium]HQK83782.1 deoxyribodipyrimidine photo-lyase [Atribacter sp.]
MNPKRVRVLQNGLDRTGPVVYWMSRDQRVEDNWALIYGLEYADRKKVPFGVIFCLVNDFLGATRRQYDFMLKGLQQVHEELLRYKIPFFYLKGNPSLVLPDFIKTNKISLLITDFDPLRMKRQWKAQLMEKSPVEIREVDAHNIVPVWIASSKQEYGAYTIRPKISRLLPEFLDEYPLIQMNSSHQSWQGDSINWGDLFGNCPGDSSLPPITQFIPGSRSALRQLQQFLKEKMDFYDNQRNDPNANAQSNLSPFLHFGQISAQRIALEVQKASIAKDKKAAFLEEVVIRRELSDNFCWYNLNYDQFAGFPSWAQQTLNQHRKDQREYRYSLEEFEKAQTHDQLWNAAQKEMVYTGKMHGYMRMYWAKKILEWSETPEIALQSTIYLNDRYELDGRDPNGYAGIAWSIGGVHDRAWGERPVFGKIRYMSYRGSRSKFDVDQYISQYKDWEESVRKD